MVEAKKAVSIEEQIELYKKDQEAILNHKRNIYTYEK